MLTITELINQHGNTKVTFNSYYKYEFYFEGTTEDNQRISCTIGGNADDIYRIEVSNMPEKLEGLAPAQVYINGELIYSS